jgi:transaldolase
MGSPAKSLLHETTLGHPTEIWNDGCEERTLARALEHGATGATSNPVLVLEAIEAAPERWRGVTATLLREHPTETEEQIAWRLVETMAQGAAKLLEPLFVSSGGKHGRLSLQVNPRLYPSAAAMVEQAKGFARLAPNMAVKLPAVSAGVVAAEELTAAGIHVNATVSFTLPQAVAVAEAMERGLKRAKASGIDTTGLTPWVTVMVGRLDDHLRDEARARGLDIDPEHVRQASTAVFRKTYHLFRERGYRAKPLAAAMRSHHHWSEFIGGELVVTIPPAWQDKFNASGVEVKRRIDDEVDPAIVGELLRTFPDFGRAYLEDGMAPAEFVSFGAAKKTLHQFLSGYEKLLAFVRGVMLPLGSDAGIGGKGAR